MRALLLVDIQNGFCPGGNLPVPDGDKVVPVANRLIDSGKYQLIVASQDWHPPGHGSFASSHSGKQPFEMGELSGKPQMLWPDHCVQHTVDSELHPELKADANFRELQDELSSIEGELAGSRRYYNATVRDLNTRVQSFPDVLFARPFGFKEEESYADADPAIQSAPRVTFGA